MTDCAVRRLLEDEQQVKMHLLHNTALWACLLFYLVCNVDGLDTECGKVNSRGRIKGGQRASIDQAPWAVTLRGFLYGVIQCGGTIIDKKWVLIAAHCIKDKPWWVTAGQTTGKTKFLHKRNLIKRSYKHPTFREELDAEGEVVSMRDDIALLELKSALRWSGSVRPICLSQTGVSYRNQDCQTVGWGDTDGEQHVSSELMKINVKVASSCKNMKHILVNPDDNLCLMHSNQMTCEGDSGGPLMCKENGRFFLKGVNSVATFCENSRGTTMFAMVAKYFEWIERVTKLDFKSITKDRPVGNARMYHKIANVGAGMEIGGNATDTPNLSAISAEKLDGLPRPDELKNSASKSLTTSQTFLFVGVPIFIIGLIAVLVVASVWIRKSSHQKNDSSDMTAHLPDPETKS